MEGLMQFQRLRGLAVPVRGKSPDLPRIEAAEPPTLMNPIQIETAQYLNVLTDWRQSKRASLERGSFR